MSGNICVPVFDDDGTVIARAQVSPDIDEEGMRLVAEVVKAAIKLQAEQDAANPEAAAERAERQRRLIERIRDRNRRLRGGAE